MADSSRLQSSSSADRSAPNRKRRADTSAEKSTPAPKQKKSRGKKSREDPKKLEWPWGEPDGTEPLVYTIWNNKGGVGKSTLTFHLATRFAERGKADGWHVLVLDMCPQANVSMTLLQGEQEDGSDRVRQHEDEVLYCDKDENLEIYQTVAGYLQRQLSTEVEPKRQVPEDRFLVDAHEYNKHIPDNLKLLCGDMDLQTVCSEVEKYRQNKSSNWRRATLWLRRFIENVCKPDGGKRWAVFIDTNPALAVYTELAVAAADYLILPVNADDYSVQAVKALFRHVYNVDEERGLRHRFAGLDPDCFAKKATDLRPTHGIKLPKIQALVNSRVMQREGMRTVKSFEMMGMEICNEVRKKFNNDGPAYNHFAHGERIAQAVDRQEEEIARATIGRKSNNKLKDPETVFKENYMFEMKDFCSNAVVCVHKGLPFSALRAQPTNIPFCENDDQNEKERFLRNNHELALKCLTKVDDLIDGFVVR